MSETNSCIIVTPILTPDMIFFGSFILLCILTCYIVYLFNKFFKQIWIRIFTTALTFIFFCLISFGLMIFGFLVGETFNDHPTFHNVHAAIKNTCYIDPLRKNCPTNKDEIIRLYPEDFSERLKDVAITYIYDQNSNHFTLILRNNDRFKANDRVTIYDSRLIQSANSSPKYGTGYDFYQTKVKKCGDKYQLISPPPFDGPWNEIN